MARWLATQGLVLTSLFAFGLGACQAVAGIEDRKLDEDAAQNIANAKQCKTYCSRVMAACTEKNAVYTSEDLCLAVCAQMDPGDPIEKTNEDTVACRIDNLTVAEGEPEDGCKNVGPGTDGACGNDCEAYCRLFPRVCKEYNDYDEEGCLTACAGLTDKHSYNLKDDHEGDTIECRLVHVSSASLDPDNHCPHAPIPPTDPWCTGKPDAAPTCKEYCQIELAACQGSNLQYDDQEQCELVCESGALDVGMNKDKTGNTIACRRYHSFNSTLLPDQHCAHSGPTGDGHCGDLSKLVDDTGTTGNCDSYCALLAGACSDEFSALGGSAGCLAECLTLAEADPESKYSVAKAEKSTGLQCRVLHAVRAFAEPTECAAAVGGDPCQ